MSKKTRVSIVISICFLFIAGGAFLFFQEKKSEDALQQSANQWITTLEKQQFKNLPELVTETSLKKQNYSAEDLINKYDAIFSGIGVNQVKISNVNINDHKLSYKMALNTAIGQTTEFQYETTLTETPDGFKINWNPNLIFPNMNATDKISYKNKAATRGNIVDANGIALATMADAFQAGVIPQDLGQDKEREKNIQAISNYLKIPVEIIEKNLAQSWVQEDFFVPLKTLPDEKVKKMTGLQYKIVETRHYPLGEVSANLIGYTGKVTAEDLEKDPSLRTDSFIGKSGLERAYDKKLRGTDGGTISLTDSVGKVKDVLLKAEVNNGEKIQLTLDSAVQKKAFEELDNAVGSTVVMEPTTGALIALVTKPSFDPNLMVRGISQTEYDAYANDINKPFMARYAQRYAPGSTMKAITAAVGLDAGTLKENNSRKIEGLQWQKDSSWGSYKITRVTENLEVDYRKALIYSDNIFFAQEGLAMGEKTLRNGFNKFGFGVEYDLPFAMDVAQISTDKKFENEILLADTAYGQGQLLMSPIQQAVAYSAFANDGKITTPHLIYKDQSKSSQTTSKESINLVTSALKKVVSDPNGTAYSLNKFSTSLAAKTGTAELKLEQGTEGEENSFLMAFNTKKKNYIVVSLVENHKKSGKTATQLAQGLIPVLEKLQYVEK